MKIPETIKVGPFNYDVETMDLLDCLGETFCDSMVIRIKAGLEQQATEETFIHEMLHAINHVYCNRSLKESDIRQMSIGIYQVLQDNNFLKK